MLESEAAALQQKHTAMVEQFKQLAAQNKTRYDQIVGAVSELREMLPKEKKNDTNTNSGNPQPDTPANRVPGDPAGPRNRGRAHLGNRAVDPKGSATKPD